MASRTPRRRSRREPIFNDIPEPGAIQVVPVDGRWRVGVDGRPDAFFDDRVEAIEAGWAMAKERSVKLFVHAKGGIYEHGMDVADELLWEIWKGIRARETAHPSPE